MTGAELYDKPYARKVKKYSGDTFPVPASLDAANPIGSARVNFLHRIGMAVNSLQKPFCHSKNMEL